jgi:hypothetical protein
MFGRQVGFWLAVAGVAALTPTAINLLADSKAGDAIPGLRTLNSYNTRRNG